MSTIEFPLFDDWFANEAPGIMTDFLKQVLEIQEITNKEIYKLRQSGFDQPVLERMIRDIQAAAFQRIESTIEILLTLGG